MNSDSSECKIAKLLTLKVIFSLALLVLIILIITHSEKISIKQDALANFVSEALEVRSCEEMCKVDFVYQNGELCCRDRLTRECERKHRCKQRLVQKDLELIAQLYTIFYCESGFTGLVFLVIVVVLYKFIQIQRKRMRIQDNPYRLGVDDGNLSDRLMENNKSQSILSNSFVLDDRQNMCVVCLSNFQKQIAVKLACNHYFHHACIEKWIAHHFTCPTCRAAL